MIIIQTSIKYVFILMLPEVLLKLFSSWFYKHTKEV